MRRLLNVLWLRPESALWYTEMLHKADKFLGNDFQGPSLEFGCMDGVNTLILLGGEFDMPYDMYKEVSWTRDSHKNSTLKDDYFNTVSNKTEVHIKAKPLKQFDYGVSWKDAHIKKSERTGAFRNCIKILLESPVLPMHDGEIKTIWAPNIYWTENFSQTVLELSRILDNDGRIITIAPDIKQLDYMLHSYACEDTIEWIKNLDRERYKNTSRHSRSYEEWEAAFKDIGLIVSRHERFIDPLLAKVYDIGMRPMFPVFMNMYEKLNSISENDLLDVKKHWIETMLHFLLPMCDNIWFESVDNYKAWHIFELKK